MASINYGAKEISVKVVYYGPGLSGKTTNLQIIHQKVPKEHKSNMVSLATETDRTLFFDFLPLDLGKIKGFSTKFQLYTVPGQVYYNATRKLVLRGVDGIVFVADSSPTKIDENLESFQNLLDNLAEYGYQRESIPVVIQYNKRDLPNALTIEELEAQVNQYHYAYTEAIASKGKGVFETLKVIGKIVIDELNRKYSRPTAPIGGTLSRPAPIAAPQRTAPQPIRQAPPVAPPPPPPQPRVAMQPPPQRFAPQQPVAQARPVAPPPQQAQPLESDDLFISSPRPTFAARPTLRIPAIEQDFVPPPAISKQAEPDFYDYNTVNLEPMQSAPAPFREARKVAPAPQYIPEPEAPVFEDNYQEPQFTANPPTESGKTDLDMEIERYQREIAQKQQRMNQPAAAAPQAFVADDDAFDLEQSMASAQPAQRQQTNPEEYDVYNLEGGNEFSPPQQAPTRPPTDQQMYFTSVNTDRSKKKMRPTNPKDLKDNKGFFSKILGKKDLDE